MDIIDKAECFMFGGILLIMIALGAIMLYSINGTLKQDWPICAMVVVAALVTFMGGWTMLI